MALDITARLRDLFPEWNKDADWPMYSFSRPATIVWDAIANVFNDHGWTESQIKTWLQSRTTRFALDAELGDALRLAARAYAINYLEPQAAPSANKFKIEIDMASLGDTGPKRCDELLACLRQVAKRIEQDGVGACLPICDTQGNKVGEWRITK